MCQKKSVSFWGRVLGLQQKNPGKKWMHEFLGHGSWTALQKFPCFTWQHSSRNISASSNCDLASGGPENSAVPSFLGKRKWRNRDMKKAFQWWPVCPRLCCLPCLGIVNAPKLRPLHMKGGGKQWVDKVKVLLFKWN